MSTAYRQPAPNCYRLTKGVQITVREEGGLASCDYPLRIVRLSVTAARLLQQCSRQCTCEELAQHLQLPIKRVQALCEQLRWKGLLEAGPKAPPPSWPGVSVIIPSHNRAAQLERCLRSLCELNYPAQCLEILVVDDASNDETSAMLARVVQEFEAQGRVLRVVHHLSRQGVAKSRNTGAEAAHHPLLAYIDSDCVASPGWLAELVPTFQDAKVAAVGGMIRAFERKSMLGRYEDVRSSLFMGVRPQQVSIEGPLKYLPTANLLVRRETWQRIGGFAPLTFGEDVDFCRRLLATKAQLIYLPQGVVYHDYRTTLWAFLNIRASYASAEAALLQRHPQERRVLVLPPEQAMFAGLMVGGLWKSLFALTLIGAYNRWRKIRQQRLPIGPFTVFRATVRGHLAYTYHLCRHLTRYYTLPLLMIGLILPPLLLLALILIAIVVGVDYVRLRPAMGPGGYALCAVLDDCAYEVGVVWGCVKHGTWKPLWPVIK